MASTALTVMSAGAVDGAKEAGVFVAVAAGNAEISTDADPSNRVIANDWNLTDTASVADPATAVGATSVASIQGEGFVTYRFSVTANGETRQLNCARISSPAFDFPGWSRFRGWRKRI